MALVAPSHLSLERSHPGVSFEATWVAELLGWLFCLVPLLSFSHHEGTRIPSRQRRSRREACSRRGRTRQLNHYVGGQLGTYAALSGTVSRYGTLSSSTWTGAASLAGRTTRDR